MSRIGKQPIEIPSGVEVNVKGQELKVKGQKGELVLNCHKNIEIRKDAKELVLKPKSLEKPGALALWGTYRMLVFNMIEGVTRGFEKKLELQGTGYKVSVSGKKLVMELGFSHSVEVEAPEGINFSVEKNQITVSGIDKQMVGQVAADIRAKKKVEPYKGKGIRYLDEFVRRKEGKKVAGEEGE
ncbi:MAG: 50S ribosomal protein L6 [Patescibacteria group bacterium]|nr:50S ribosomal protein L6 [Patescibacteria group bacterium]